MFRAIDRWILERSRRETPCCLRAGLPDGAVKRMDAGSSKNRVVEKGSGHHAKRSVAIHRHNIASAQIIRETANSGRLRGPIAALQNLHPQFKSGRRLQSFLNDFDDSGRPPPSRLTKGSGKGSGLPVFPIAQPSVRDLGVARSNVRESDLDCVRRAGAYFVNGYQPFFE